MLHCMRIVLSSHFLFQSYFLSLVLSKWTLLLGRLLIHDQALLLMSSFYRYPYPKDCQKHSFFTYYFSDAVGKSV